MLLGTAGDGLSTRTSARAFGARQRRLVISTPSPQAGPSAGRIGRRPVALDVRDALAARGVQIERTYVDHGLTGTNRDRPGLREALAACRSGDTLVVRKLDRLARSLPDARDILEDLTTREVKLSIGGSVHDPTDPVGRLLVHRAGEPSTAEPSDLFGVGRSTVYRVIKRARGRRKHPSAPRAGSNRGGTESSGPPAVRDAGRARAEVLAGCVNERRATAAPRPPLRRCRRALGGYSRAGALPAQGHATLGRK